MSEKKTGGHAFPGFNYVSSNVHDGMTLRDYFAAKAMQAMLSDPGTLSAIGKIAERERIKDPSVLIGAKAYCIADAMLKAREA